MAIDITLITAQEAAKLLNVDVKTFRKMPVPFIIAGNSRRYTRTILENWVEQSVQECRPIGQSIGRRGYAHPVSRHSRGKMPGWPGKRAPATIDFEQVAGLITAEANR